MANKGVKQSTRGNLNKDVDPKAMRNGDYEDALDVLHINKGSNKSLNAEPTLGNKYAFTIEPRVAQNKRIRFNIPTQANYEATVFKTDGVTPLFSFFFSNPTDFTVNFAVGAGAAGLQINFVETTSTFVTVEILTPAYYDWFVSSVGSVEFTFDVLQEALSPNYIGIPKIIGSVDLLGNLFVFSTTKTQEQRDFTITDIYNSGGRIGISTSEPHGLQNGFEVSISGTQIDRYADGLWIVQVINASSFILQLSDASTLNLSVPVTGKVSVYVRGYGEIGVAVKDLNTDSWQYTRLLGSKEFNFDTFHLIECRAEANNLGNSLYFHQVLRNVPKVFYYNQETFVQDGGLSINGGQYEYGNIFLETQLINEEPIPTPYFLRQDNTGGNITAGNKRYIIRLSNNFTKSTWSDPTGLINVYSASINNPETIDGNIGGETTPKVNYIKVDGINNDIYQFIELGVIEYLGGAVVAKNLYRVPVLSTSIELKHTGYEQTISDLPLEELINVSLGIEAIGNSAILDNRLVHANIFTEEQIDIQAFANTVKYSLHKEFIPSTAAGSYQSFQYGGYQNPTNTCNVLGFMMNEEYRFGISAILNNGSETQVFHTFDVKFDTNQTSADGKRLFSFTDYDNCNFNVETNKFDLLVPYIRFYFDLNFIVNGVPLKTLVKKIKIHRAERVPEVLASGIIANVVVLENFDNGQDVEGKPLMPYWYVSNPANFNGQININPTNIEFVTSGSGFIINNNQIFYYPEQKINNFPNFSAYKKACVFFSPDTEYLNSIDGLLEGAFIRVFSNNGGSVTNTNNVSSSFWYRNICEQFQLNSQIQTETEIKEKKYLEKDENFTFLSINKEFKKSYEQVFDNLGSKAFFSFEKSYVFLTDSDLPTPINEYSPRYFYAQIFKPSNNKYGDINTTKYTYCCADFLVKQGSPLVNISVFGGDTFTSKTWQKYLYGNVKGKDVFPNPDPPEIKFGSGFGYFSQSYINYDMRIFNQDSVGNVFPISTPNYFDWMGNPDQDQYNYDVSYNYHPTIVVKMAFDNLLVYFKRYKTRIIYSLLKPQGSILDLYRIFPPLQYYDLDPQYGEITHIEVLNNELYAWQERKVNRMFFNTTGVLTTVEGDISVLGNQGVLSRKPIALSAFGTKHKFSVVKGTSAGGQDVAYWINSESNMLMRFGADGSVAISILWGLMGFLNDNLKWAQQNLKYTGNRYGYGIYGVWDERFKEAIFTVRAAKDVDDWQIRQSYTANRSNFSVVRNYNQLQFSTFEESPDIFICTQAHTATADTEPGVGVNWQSYWVVAPHTDNNYYNEYTIALNEIKNGFSTFYTHKPAIYMRYRNKFLTAHPKMKYSNTSFEHREGEYLTWYNYEGEEQTSTGYIMPIINIDPEAIKWYLAVWMVTKFAPFRMEFYTDKHESFLDTEDFEEREGVWISNIKNDLDNITQRNDLDTSQLYGSYLKVKIFFEPKKFQQFFDFVTLLRLSQRSYVN